jgi:hypothetical protein
MRAGIRWRIGERDDDDPEGGTGGLTKNELLAIASAVDDGEEGNED